VTTTNCVICWADDSEEPDTAAWTEAVLPAAIPWRSAFVPDGQLPVTPAGPCRLCPPCTAWLPGYRIAPLPAAIAELVDGLVAMLEHPMTRSKVRAELVGQVRHLGSQLQPIERGDAR
jgi:hypothetical protein